MSPEKALNYLDGSNFEVSGEDPGRVRDALNMAREALTKTIICEPETQEGGDLVCSVCHAPVKSKDRFCAVCGQKLR